MGEEYFWPWYIDKLWHRENEAGLRTVEGKGGYSNGRYFPYITPLGNTDLGPGFDMDKQTDKEFVRKAYTEGFTKKELDSIATERLKRENSYFNQRITKEGGDSTAVDRDVRAGLLDMYWQVNNSLYGYDKLWKAVADKDYEKMREESATYYEPKNGKYPKDAIIKNGKILDQGRWEYRKKQYFHDPSFRTGTTVRWANGGLLQPQTAWDKLSMAEKSEMMKVAVHHGITNLQQIRAKYNEFAEGGSKGEEGEVNTDRQYFRIMEKVADENYQKWGFSNPDEALLHALNDNTYDYRGYYNKYPQSQANADTHWTDEFKTAYHPTFSRESVYSGRKSQYNPLGLPGGFWSEETFVPMGWQLGANKYKKGGGIHIKDSKKGTFTAAASKHGMGVQKFASRVLAHPENYSPAMRKKANFARNATKWHGLGGNLFDGESEETQQMQKSNGHAIFLNYPNAEGSLTGAIRIGGIDIGAAFGKVTGITSLPFGHAGVILVDENGNSEYYDYGRYKEGTDKFDVHTFGTIKPRKGNWRTKKLPKQESGENDSVYVARIQNGLPDTQFGTYQALSFPKVDINKAKAYVKQQANDPNRPIYGFGNTCVDAAYKSIVPFIQDPDVVEKRLALSPEEYNTEGYSPFSLFWSQIPGSVGYTGATMRKLADKTYIMNKKK